MNEFHRILEKKFNDVKIKANKLSPALAQPQREELDLCLLNVEFFLTIKPFTVAAANEAIEELNGILKIIQIFL